MRIKFLTVLLWLITAPAWAATYWIGPTSQGLNDGSSSANRWGSFSTAFGTAGCGDTLNLDDGVYGDGTSTGKISISSLSCAVGNELVVQAVNERQARINDNGLAQPVFVTGSSGINFIGLTTNSANNVSGTGTQGTGGYYVVSSSRINIYRGLSYNPNKYLNRALILYVGSTDSLVEQFEGYDFHRHCVTAFTSQRITVRLTYCNSRTGMISSGYNNGAGVGTGNALMAMYPCKDCILESSIAESNVNGMRLNEMNATFSSSILLSGSKVLGSVCLNCDTGNGIYPNARPGTGSNYVPQDILIENNAFVNSNSASAGISCVDCLRVTINKNTILDSHTTGINIADNTSRGITPAEMDVTVTSNVVKGSSGTGFNLAVTPGTFSDSNNGSNGNGTNYSAGWTSTDTTDPGFGDCKVFAPDGSDAQTDGRGANVLYRYSIGIETTIPLWDPTTGQFPVGATVTGINDTTGDSAFDVHQRLNIPYPGDTHTCNFPATYPLGTPAQDPSTYETSEGTTSTSHAHTLGGSTTHGLVAVALRDSAGNVGSVSTVTGCASESYTLVTGSRTVTPDGSRAVEWWEKASPTTGACTMAVTTTGQVTGVITTSIAVTASSASDDVAVANGLSDTPTVTVPTNTSETLFSQVAVFGSAVVTAGANQTLQTDTAHTTQNLKQSISTQSGNDGGVMDYTLSAASYWATSTVAILPTTPDGGPNPAPVLTAANYQFHALYGTEVSPTKLPHANAAANTPIAASTIAAFRLRYEIEASGNTTPAFGVALYCQTNGGGYSKAANTVGSNAFRLFGLTETYPDIPSSLTAATQQLDSGNYVAGALITSDSTAFTVPSMTSVQQTEVEWVVVLVASAGDTIQCRPQKDDGTALDAYTNTATINVVGIAGATGF